MCHPLHRPKPRPASSTPRLAAEETGIDVRDFVHPVALAERGHPTPYATAPPAATMPAPRALGPRFCDTEFASRRAASLHCPLAAWQPHCSRKLWRLLLSTALLLGGLTLDPMSAPRPPDLSRSGCAAPRHMAAPASNHPVFAQPRQRRVATPLRLGPLHAVLNTAMPWRGHVVALGRALRRRRCPQRRGPARRSPAALSGAPVVAFGRPTRGQGPTASAACHAVWGGPPAACHTRWGGRAPLRRPLATPFGAGGAPGRPAIEAGQALAYSSSPAPRPRSRRPTSRARAPWRPDVPLSAARPPCGVPIRMTPADRPTRRDLLQRRSSG